MKIRHLVGLGLTAAAGYKIYQNRQQITNKIRDTKEVVEQGQLSLAEFQTQKQELTQTLPEIKALADNFNYKLRVFEQESKPHIEAIQEILNKYQKKDSDKK